MFVLIRPRSLWLLCLTLLVSTQVFSAEKLSLSLQQSVDTNCDGVLETAYTSDAVLKALPQQCVMYKISVKNISGETLHNIVINGKIPSHTQLLFNRSYFYKNDELYLNRVFNSKNSAKINSKPTTLLPNNTLTMLYSVRVNTEDLSLSRRLSENMSRSEGKLI